MDLKSNVQNYIQANQLLSPGEALVVGVSGGPDSVVLLDLLRRLAEPYALKLHVAHLHHGIRGDEADADADFVVALAEKWGLPCSVEHINLPKLAQQDKLSLEEAARRERYAFLTRTAQKNNCAKIAVGHNADDQAETVLMHLLRGAGPAGLRGMLPATCLRDYHLSSFNLNTSADKWLIRPLLATTRADIEAYAQTQDLQHRFDQSNLDTTFFRNQLRHEVLPYLQSVTPKISRRLRQLAEIVRADYILLEEFVSVAWDNLLITEYSDAFTFDLQGWRAQPLAVQRALIRHAVFRLRQSLRDVDFSHIETAVRLALHGKTGALATLPRGVQLTIGYTSLTVGDRNALHLPPEHPWLDAATEIVIKTPGKTSLLGGWALHSQPAPHWNWEAIADNPNPLVAWINAEALGDAPVLRTRQQGDRIHPQGMQGQEMRLSDFLINAKVPRQWRDHLPLLVGREKILWVAGMRLSDAALIHPHTQDVVYFRFRGPEAKQR